MQVIPYREIPRLLRAAGLEPTTREFPDVSEIRRLTVRECNPPPYTRGPHRKAIYPDGRVDGPYPIVDRPALSAFVAAIFHSLPVQSVLAVIPEGALWLNNKSHAAYFDRVPDAQRVCAFLRRRCLTDRFRGGFCVQRAQFNATLPMLAANTFSGGADVLFAAVYNPSCLLTVLACHHFDLHISTPHADSLARIAGLTQEYDLMTEDLALPDLPALFPIFRQL